MVYASRLLNKVKKNSTTTTKKNLSNGLYAT
jgi:hypothetical protein